MNAAQAERVFSPAAFVVVAVLSVLGSTVFGGWLARERVDGLAKEIRVEATAAATAAAVSASKDVIAPVSTAQEVMRVRLELLERRMDRLEGRAP